MDMLYHRYACPMDLMNGYINRGRFGEFVSSFLEAEYERRKEEVEKDDDLKLWIMYVHTAENETFTDWKNRALKVSAEKGKRKANGDAELTDEGINAIVDELFPA